MLANVSLSSADVALDVWCASAWKVLIQHCDLISVGTGRGPRAEHTDQFNQLSVSGWWLVVRIRHRRHLKWTPSSHHTKMVHLRRPPGWTSNVHEGSSSMFHGVSTLIFSPFTTLPDLTAGTGLPPTHPLKCRVKLVRHLKLARWKHCLV